MIPAAGLAHWEGFEAADPTTPAALLSLDSAAGRYTASDVTLRPWRELFAERETRASPERPHNEPDPGAETDAAQPPPATTRQ
jgi:hypothetical protein